MDRFLLLNKKGREGELYYQRKLADCFSQKAIYLNM